MISTGRGRGGLRIFLHVIKFFCRFSSDYYYFFTSSTNDSFLMFLSYFVSTFSKWAGKRDGRWATITFVKSRKKFVAFSGISFFVEKCESDFFSFLVGLLFFFWKDGMEMWLCIGRLGLYCWMVGGGRQLYLAQWKESVRGQEGSRYGFGGQSGWDFGEIGLDVHIGDKARIERDYKQWNEMGGVG